MPIQRVMSETTSTEFAEWQAYFRQELEATTREEYYMAQIAAEVRRGNAKNPRGVRLEDFILSLKTTDAEAEAEGDEPPDEETLARRTAVSKAFWFGVANYKGQ